MRGLTATVLVGLCLTAQAGDETPEETFADVTARLSAPEVLRGEFKQIRKLEQISKPLESEGNFILSDMGLYWQQNEPVASVMIADGERLLQRAGDGPLREIDISKNPAALTFSQSFLSIFEGDEGALRENFDIGFSPGDDGYWVIDLAPKVYPMSEAIATITIAGHEQIEQLTVVSVTSEETIIRFTKLQTEPDHLTEDEVELYAR